jgi:hypothetical protein
MRTYSVKRFSVVASGKIMNTRMGLGFSRTRKYDTDLDRLGRIDTAQGELSKPGQLGKEMRELRRELRDASIGR